MAAKLTSLRVMWQKWRPVAWLEVLGGTLILLLPAVFNGYPLFYWDSASYLHNGFENLVPPDRPAGYGNFIAWTSIGRSLWYPVVIQCALTSLVIREICQVVLQQRYKCWHFISISVILVFFTGIAWISNQLMPDFFTPLVFLLLFLILFDKSHLKKLLYGFILIIALMCHFTHALLAIGLLLFFAAHFLFLWRIRRQTFPGLGMGFAALFVLLGILAMPLLHYKNGGQVCF